MINIEKSSMAVAKSNYQLHRGIRKQIRMLLQTSYYLRTLHLKKTKELVNLMFHSHCNYFWLVNKLKS